ncbi:MAG: hypothetical protein LAN64_06775 [Acidobacteriia bacterium]|nr:hypothetical protein [Terriglobia bacterium]
MNLELLTRELQEFLGGSTEAVVLEDGAVAFDLREARYSISEQHGKCLLHLWSHERNVVRRVLEVESGKDSLQLTVLRFGQTRPTKLEICRSRDRRSVSAKNTARAQYRSLLTRLVEREFPTHKLGRLTSSTDLEHSFGPVYARGVLRRGNAWTAVLGVNAEELQASIDGSLTFGLLWLDNLRERCGKNFVESLALFVPAGTSAVVRARMAHLARGACKWRLLEVHEPSGEMREIDCSDAGNIETRLVRCADEAAARARFQTSIARVLSLVPQADIAIVSPGEIALRLHGLEFARARMAMNEASFRASEELVFGAGASETVVTDDNAEQFAAFVEVVRAARQAHSDPLHPLRRACPERWLESLVLHDVTAIDARLDAACVYSQVPAFSASDRAMIDVLAATRERRLAVIELKADEDIHLPLQGLDYWARVCWHQQRGEFTKFGYFPGRELSAEPPLLLLVAPALHVHPATDTLLRYLSPAIEWQLVAVDERWREGVRVVFRKHPIKELAADLRR